MGGILYQVTKHIGIQLELLAYSTRTLALSVFRCPLFRSLLSRLVQGKINLLRRLWLRQIQGVVCRPQQTAAAELIQ